MKSKFTRSLLVFSITLSFISGVVAFALTFQSIGLDQGLEIGEVESDEKLRSYGVEPIRFSSGLGTYRYLAYHYGWLLTDFIAILIGNLCALAFSLNRARLLLLTSLSFLVSIHAILNVRRMLIDKNLVVTWFYDASRNYLAKITIYYDWMFLTFIILMVIAQILVLVSSFRSSTHNES